MSQENVELIRDTIAESNATGGVALRALHPDVKWHLDSNHPDQKVLDGHAEVEEYFSHWQEAFDEIRIDAEDFIDSGGHVVMPFVAHGRLKGPTAEVPLAETWVFTFRDGLVAEVHE